MRKGFQVLLSACMLGFATALPADKYLSARDGKLIARGAKLDPSCGKTNPFKTGETFATKVNQALDDVKTLAKEVVSGTVIKGDVNYRISDAFFQYFQDEEYDQVMKMMKVVADIDSYDFNILCGSDMGKESCVRGSWAATNVLAGSPNIILCDKFFDTEDQAVTRNLGDRDDSSGRKGWCQKDEAGNPSQKFPFFSVAGLTLFHEITHLDLIGAAAGLSERTYDNTKSHGTIDIYDQGGDDNLKYYKRKNDRGVDVLMLPYDAARQLEHLWGLYDLDNGRYEPLGKTFENAESYAASALQWHFEILCKFSIESDWTAPPEIRD